MENTGDPIVAQERRNVGGQRTGLQYVFAVRVYSVHSTVI